VVLADCRGHQGSSYRQGQDGRCALRQTRERQDNEVGRGDQGEEAALIDGLRPDEKVDPAAVSTLQLGELFIDAISVGPARKDDVKFRPLCKKLLANLGEQLHSFVRPNLAEEQRDFRLRTEAEKSSSFGGIERTDDRGEVREWQENDPLSAQPRLVAHQQRALCIAVHDCTSGEPHEHRTGYSTRPIRPRGVVNRCYDGDSPNRARHDGETGVEERFPEQVKNVGVSLSQTEACKREGELAQAAAAADEPNALSAHGSERVAKRAIYARRSASVGNVEAFRQQRLSDDEAVRIEAVGVDEQDARGISQVPAPL
jgi:hypothetical protein